MVTHYDKTILHIQLKQSLPKAQNQEFGTETTKGPFLDRGVCLGYDLRWAKKERSQ